MLNDAVLDDLRTKYGKVGVVSFEGHELVFRRPSREQVREYRRKEDSPTEKPDRVDQLAQQTIVAFDDVVDPIQTRTAFLSFLDSYPMFCDTPKLQTVITLLAGGMEEQQAALLGKGCRILNGTPKASPKG